MTKFIILGDVHLGKGMKIGKPGQGGVLNSRISDQLNLLNWVHDQAIKHDVKTIFLTGDVYEDTRPHPTLIYMFMSWLKQCERSNIQVHIVVGNHDIANRGWYTSSALDIIPALELPYAKTYSSIDILKLGDTSVTLMPYRDRRLYNAETLGEGLENIKKELSSVQPSGKTKILIGHLAIEGSLYIGDEIDDMQNELFCPVDIFKEYDYVWMGHIHKPQVLSKATPRVAHIGSMDRSDFSRGELDHDKFIILFDSNLPETFKKIYLPVRPLRKIQITVPQDKETTDFIINELHSFDKVSSLKDAIVKLEVQLEGQETPNAERAKIFKYIYEHLDAHYVCNFSESRSVVVVDTNTDLVLNAQMRVSVAAQSFIDSCSDIEQQDRDAVLEFISECIAEYESKHGSV